jgi:hypothetical protein
MAGRGPTASYPQNWIDMFVLCSTAPQKSQAENLAGHASELAGSMRIRQKQLANKTRKSEADLLPNF